MFRADEVTPGRWADLQVLYDDGQYSAVWGTFSGVNERPRTCLGVRWNGRTNHPGFPNQGGHPIWHVEPDILTRPILNELLRRAEAAPDDASHRRSVQNIRAALTAFGDQG